MPKLTLNDITTGYAAREALNTNSGLIEDALENTLSRDGTGPNQMEADLDMNSNDILNVNTFNGADAATLSANLDVVAGSIGSVNTVSDNIADVNVVAANIVDVQNAEENANAAIASAAAAAVSETNAAVSASEAALSAASAQDAETGAIAAAVEAQGYASVGFDVASTIYDFGFIIDPSLTFSTDYGSVAA